MKSPDTSLPGGLDRIYDLGTQRRQVLKENGVETPDDLARLPVRELQALFAGKAGAPLGLHTWPFQAALVAAGLAPPLEALQQRIREGQRHLLLLNGLGPEAATALRQRFGGYEGVAGAEADVLREILTEHGQPELSPGFLKDQAALAAAEEWSALIKRWAAPTGGQKTPGDADGPDDSDDSTTNPPPSNDGGGGTPSEPTDHSDGGTTMSSPIVIVDMRDRNAETADRLHHRRDVLSNKIQEAQEKNRIPDRRLVEERDQINEKLEDHVVDPLFLAIQEDLRAPDDPDDSDDSDDSRCTVKDHVDGKLPSQQGDAPKSTLTAREKELTTIYGILLRDNAVDPERGARFSRQISLARSEYHARRNLFDRVLDVLVDLSGRQVRAEHAAAVGRTLGEQNVRSSDPLIRLRAEAALSHQTHVTDEAPGSVFDIVLPDLDKEADTEIVADNIKAMQALYFAAMVDGLRAFQAVDACLKMAQEGTLAFGRGPDMDRLFKYGRDKVYRLSEYERANIFARVLGLPGGDAHVRNPNRNFQTLMLRFVAAVSRFARQLSVDSLLRSSIPLGVHQEQVRKTGCDLGANLSLFGYGMAWNFAVELQKTIEDVFAILGSEEVKAAFGARDAYQVIEQVAALELGVTVDTMRYRTLAASGGIIIRWVAEHAAELCSSGYGAILDLDEILHPAPHPSGSSPTTHPHDSDLVNACERYLAATGTADRQVEELSSTYLASSIPSRPIQMPSAARDMLESAGINMGGDGSFSIPDIGV